MSQQYEPLDPDDAKHGFDVTMELLASLETIGPDVRPASFLLDLREQLAKNVDVLLRGYYLPQRTSSEMLRDKISAAIRNADQQADFMDDPIMTTVFGMMAAFDRRDWTAAIVELRALRLVMKIEPVG